MPRRSCRHAATKSVGRCGAVFLIAVVVRFKESAKFFFSHHDWHYYACVDGAVIAMFQKRFFNDKLTLHVKVQLHRGVHFDCISV